MFQSHAFVRSLRNLVYELGPRPMIRGSLHCTTDEFHLACGRTENMLFFFFNMFSVRPHAWVQRRNSEAIQNKSLREVLEYSASQNDLKTRTVLSCSDFEHTFYLLFDARMVPTQSPTLCRTGHKGRWSWRCRQNDQYPGVVSLVVCCPSSRSFWMVILFEDHPWCLESLVVALSKLLQVISWFWVCAMRFDPWKD